MKKTNLKRLSMQVLAWSFIGGLLMLAACKEDEVEPTVPVASFQFEVDETDFQKVTFANFSTDATIFAWDFGDTETSTDKDPVHSYANTGTYKVILLASDILGNEVEFSQDITITDPLEAERSLIGANGKVWQLLADASTGVNSFEVGPSDRSQVWWSFGGVEELCVRECITDDTWTFNTDGTFTFENNGDFWADSGVWPDELVGCFDTSVPENWVGKDGQDLTGWDSGTHGFTYDPTAATITTAGGFIGLSKAGTNAEVFAPEASVTYSVIKLVDTEDVDTLVLETTIEGGYWAATLVSYNNPTDVIVVDECPAVTSVDVTFKLNLNDYTGSAVTPEVNGTFNDWCGNCNVMTDDNSDGIWEVTLNLPVGDHEFKYSADNWADQEALTDGSACTITSDGNTNRTLTVGSTNMTVGPVCWNSCENCPAGFTAADIVGSWKLAAEAGALGVGPSSGDVSWWSNSADDLTTRACTFDDVYTFVNDGSFTIQQDGSTWVEVWQGATADGCAAPVSPHNGSGTYTYQATATTVKVIGSGAFLGLAKAYNGGELAADVTAPGDITYTVTNYSVAGDGTKSLTIEVDISANQDATAFWTVRLVSQ